MKTLLAVLSMIPGLTATQPLPPRTVTADEYNDFETAIVEKHTDNEEQYYKVNVKNTGEGYINRIGLLFNDRECSYRAELEETISRNYVIAPNQEATFVIFTDYDLENLRGLSIYASAYTAFTDELTVTGSKTITSSSSNNYFYNTVDMSFGHTGRDQYCYGAIIKAYVEEKETYFVLDKWNSFSFTTTKEVKGNENNEVEVVKTLKTEYIGYEQERTQSDFFYRAKKGCFGSILFGVPAAASLGLVTTFVVALRRSAKKNKSK